MKNYYFWRWIELGGGEPQGVDESRCACGSGVHDFLDLFVIAKASQGDARRRVDAHWHSRRRDRLVVVLGEDGEIVLRDMEGLGVCGCRVHGVAQVAKERITLPTQPHLDVCIRETLTVEEICSRDSDGVC